MRSDNKTLVFKLNQQLARLAAPGSASAPLMSGADASEGRSGSLTENHAIL